MRTMLPGIVVLALLVSGCAGTATGNSPARTEMTPAATDTSASNDDAPVASTLPPPESEVVVVDTVLDGDSLAVTRNGRRTEVRLAGVNAPEADECYGDDARSHTESLVGDEVILVRVDGDDDQDQFGRLLRNVWAAGTWVNLTLVQEGAALALQTGSADEPALVAAEDAAWQAGAGMWGSSVCGKFTARLRITDVRYDPPGRDLENTAEEFILLANEGETTIDLGGWIVRDESSTHRYMFPSGFRLEPEDGIRLRSGCGPDTGRDLYWCADDAVWSNGGDTIIVQTATGTVVDRWKYPGDF